MIASNKAPWCAVQTKPGGEYLARTEMERVGMVVYLPQYRHEYRHHRNKTWITKSFPLFAGYVFTPLNDVKWGALNVCNGVMKNGVLCDTTGKPVPIADANIADIRDGEEKGAFDKLRSHGLRLKPGDDASVSEGALAGMTVEVVAARSARNVQVLLDMFGSKIVAKGPVAKIRRAG